MKKALATLLTLTLLMGSLATTALAYDLEVVEEGPFTITDVYGKNYYSDGTPDYLCEDTTTITINNDFEVLHIFIFNYSTYTWDEIGLNTTYLDEYIFDSTDFNVTMVDSGMTYTVMDYFTGVEDGSIDVDEEYDLLAGNAFTALCPLDFNVYITYADGTYDECYFGVYSADELGDMDIDEVLVMEVADDDAEEVVVEEAETEEVEEVVVEEAETDEVVVDEPEVLTAAATAYPVLVDGEEVAFDAYNIADNNYFKLRDIAYVLNGTEASFEVTWNQDAQAIDMISGETYTAAGGELTLGDGTAKAYATSTATIYLNGEEITLTAYTIADNNYFKLRDLGEALGFNVSWDQDAQTIVIASNEAYTAD